MVDSEFCSIYFTDVSGDIGLSIYYEPHWAAEVGPSEVADFSIE